MGTKFHIGDVVRSLRDHIAYPEKGDIGIVTQVRGGEYGVEWKFEDHTSFAAWFSDEDIELVRKFEWPEL